MSIALFSFQTLPLSEIATLLRSEGIVVSETFLENLNDNLEFSQKLEKAILIFHKHGVAETIERIRHIFEIDKKLIVCCPQQSTANYELLMNLGVDEFISPKSWSSFHIVERILGQLIVEGDIERKRLGRMHGATRAVREIYDEISTVAPLADPVLILGETGTGKELVAGEIHRLSKREGKFIALNCSEFSSEIVESELFGHTKGSFTGAGGERKGLILESGAGTVFLDEIGELPISIQSKLLRVIEEKKIRPVGANHWIDVKARFLLATNRNLEEEIQRGNFRQDLFERIRGFTISLPALRERLADILLLFNLFLEEYCNEYNQIVRITPNSLDPLFTYKWAGNVRELRSVVRNLAAHAVSTEDGLYISPLRLLEMTSKKTFKKNLMNSVKFDPTTETLDEVLHRTEIIYLQSLLGITENNKERAIKLSGVSRSTFYEKIKPLTSDT